MCKLIGRMLLALMVLAAQVAPAAENQRKPLIVFAAASLTDVLQRIGPQYTQSSGIAVKFSFAASSALAKQIESGARADVFVSADQEWMNYLNERELIKRDTRQDLLGNRLVLIAPLDSTVSVKLAPGAPLLAALGKDGRLATGDPDSVPAGRYAKAALTSLNVWDALQPRLARAENVRVALTYVARGETPLGIVYATDAAVEPKVKVVDVFPQTSHPPIMYPIAATKVAAADAASFIEFLHGGAAQTAFKEAGFSVIAPKP
jgi:molybdate transport system substrate-binding protein